MTGGPARLQRPVYGENVNTLTVPRHGNSATTSTASTSQNRWKMSSRSATRIVILCLCCVDESKQKLAFINTVFTFRVLSVPGSRCSSGSIVSGYGLDDRAIGVRSPAGAEDFSSSLCVQTGSGAQPSSCTMGTGVPFPGGKARPGRDTDHSPPPNAEVENK